MGTNLISDADDLGGLTVRSFWGGDERGPCIQVTIGDDFTQLNYHQVKKLHGVLYVWIAGHLPIPPRRV